MVDEVDFVTCRNCDTPCYTFELDAKRRIVSAFCATCGNEDVLEFTVSEAGEEEPEE